MNQNSAPLERLTSLLKGEPEFVSVHTQNIIISYYTNVNTELTVRVEDPQLMIGYLNAAFAMSGSSLFSRFNRPHHACPVFVEIPGEIVDPQTNQSREKCLARLRFLDHNTPAQLSFNDDGNTLEGPTLSAFISALSKAGNDWEKVDLRPAEKPHLKLVVKHYVPQP